MHHIQWYNIYRGSQHAQSSYCVKTQLLYCYFTYYLLFTYFLFYLCIDLYLLIDFKVVLLNTHTNNLMLAHTRSRSTEKLDFANRAVKRFSTFSSFTAFTLVINVDRFPLIHDLIWTCGKRTWLQQCSKYSFMSIYVRSSTFVLGCVLSVTRDSWISCWFSAALRGFTACCL